MVCRLGADADAQKRGGVHTASQGGGDVRGAESGGRDGCRTGTAGWIQHSFRRLHVIQHHTQVCNYVLCTTVHYKLSPFQMEDTILAVDYSSCCYKKLPITFAT